MNQVIPDTAQHIVPVKHGYFSTQSNLLTAHGEEVATAAIRDLHEEAGVLVQAVTALFSLNEQGEADERVVAADLPLL